jgi:type I restriction enzyme S subunit
VTRLVPLKRVADIRFSSVDKLTVEGQTPVRLCNYTDVYYNDRIGADLPFMNATASPEQIRRFELQQGDVLMTKDSETSDDIGVTAFVPHHLPGVVCGYHLALIRPGASVDGGYLRWALESDAARQQFSVAATGVTRFGLREDAVGSVTVPIPSQAAQRAIAGYIDATTARVDAMVERYRRIVEGQREKRRAITSAGVEGQFFDAGRRQSGLTYIHTIPQHWDEVRLSLLAKLGSGHTPSRGHPEWWVDPTIPWITTGEVRQLRDDRVEYVSETRESISEVGIANSAAELHPADTVFLSRTASAGFSGIMARDMATSQDFVTWTCGSRIRPRFLLLCLRAMRGDLLGRLAMGSTHKTIYFPDIQSIKVPLPPVEEQDRIVEWAWMRLRAIDAATDAIQRQTSLLLERRRAVITAAVTGTLEIPGVAA